MSGQIAAAKAYLKAGNTSAAISQVQEILKSDPSHSGALAVMSEALLKDDRYTELVNLSLRWLELDPKDPNPYAQLMHCYMRLNEKAKCLSTLKDFESTFPHLKDEIEMMSGHVEARFGSAKAGFGKLIKANKQRGNSDNATFFEGMSALADESNFKAYRKFEEIYDNGERNPVVLQMLARLSFFTFRFENTRKFARLTLRQNSQSTVAKELMILSWAVLFPPFFVAHVFLMVLSWLASKSKSHLLPVIVLTLTFTIWMIFPLAVLASMASIGVPPVATLGFMLGWVCYAPNVGLVSRLMGGGKKPEIALRDY
jgi:hypothetical protein